MSGWEIKMEIAKLVLEFVRLLCSAPFMLFVTVCFLSCKFYGQIKELLHRIASIRFGGTELTLKQIQAKESENNTPIPKATSPNGVLSGLPETDNQQIYDIIKSESEKALLWEFRYLNYFLVPRTQNILIWLASLPNPISIADALHYSLALVSDESEVDAMRKALEAHQLIKIDDKAVYVTEKGRTYLQWRGPFPLAVK
jgi:hypothetical protein